MMPPTTDQLAVMAAFAIVAAQFEEHPERATDYLLAAYAECQGAMDAWQTPTTSTCKRCGQPIVERSERWVHSPGREGAAFGPQGTYWDVKAVNGAHNEKVGRELAAMYSNERYFHGDTFNVDVRN
jgi:hypothetical protein